MDNKDLTFTEVTASTTAGPESASPETRTKTGATRRRHRSPTRPGRAQENPSTPEIPESNSQELAAPLPEPPISAAPPEASSPRSNPRGRRGGRRSNKAPAAEAPTEEATLAAPIMEADAPESARESVLRFEERVAPFVPPAPVLEPALPVATDMPAVAPEAPRPAHRYRFDRPAQPPPTVAPAPTPAAAEPRRLGPLHTLFTPRPVTPPAPRLDEPPEPELEPEPETLGDADIAESPLDLMEAELLEGLDATPLFEEGEDQEQEAEGEDLPAATAADVSSSRGRRRRRRRGGTNNNGHNVSLAESGAGELGAIAPSAPQPSAPPPVIINPPAVAITPPIVGPTHVQSNRQSPGGTAPAPLAGPAQPAPAFQEPSPPASLATPAQPPTPYGSPEPAYARGFGPTPRGIATEYRTPAPPRLRPERENGAPISPNHLATVITSALQQQTDRLMAETRRHSATPVFTLALPSTERVGVFVDVANLIYSSRSMRIPIDFGKLLAFLRGDRRLIRAHAYCPTSPEPYADQAFLQAVKGVGYRITTKDYKTFSSGAKKADLDLDLCMDIVRIVDAGAVDTIILVSGDSDFLPLLDYCSDKGVRVEVAAFDESTAAILRQSCDLFLNLSLVEEIRAGY